ncbi:ATPase [bacterium]|nr:ATPase [bacterium]
MKRSISREKRKDRNLKEHYHDTYKSQLKLPEPTLCPKCQAVFENGRWRWARRPVGAYELICPACHRIRDKFPAGILILNGEFLGKHKDEILNLCHNEETNAKQKHPLHHIMEIAEERGCIKITFTDNHLPRRIGDALFHAYKGELDFHYAEEDKFIRVTWKR